MKRSTVVSFCGIVALALFASADNYAQTRSPVDAGSKQEQVMQDLLDEVHQLRVAMQYISVNAYRGQVMVERLRLQHEEVDRLTRDLDAIRSQIGEIRNAQISAKQQLDEAESRQDKGLSADRSVSRVRAAVEEINRRELSLTERESQLSVDLAMERANLVDLNKRLDALEREMLITGSDQKKDSKKR